MLSVSGELPQSGDAHEALRRTRARLLAFLEHAPDAIFIKGADGRYTDVSRSFLALAGRPAAEVIGRTDFDLFATGVARRFQEQDDQVRRKGVPCRFEDAFDYGGRSFSFLSTKFPLPGGEVACIATNITDRNAERAAHEQTAERLRLAIEGTGLGVYENNLSTGEGFWSESAFRVLGLEPTPDLKGSYQLWRSRVHPDDVERAEREHAAARARGGPWSVQYRVIHQNGDVRWVSAYGQFTRRGDESFSTGIAIDITDQKRLEERQALLLGELNHRVKNMLAIVQSIAAQTFAGGGVEAERRRSFEGRLLALAHAHDLLQQDRWEAVGLRRLVEQAISPFEQGGGRSFDIDGPDAQLSTSRCVALSLALHELCTNAVKYGALSRAEGKVAIRWSIADGRIRFEWKESGGPSVALPRGSGFGSRMLRSALARELGSEVHIDFEADGLRCSFDAAL